ncbi:hypothetical protein Fmac_010554 [Flemingia macrophylla]|uniref:Polygalacturonase n=1 Tax=Flemingia macrophylla TaxID=520843 RepID=A0ABD1MKR7_9FABA
MGVIETVFLVISSCILCSVSLGISNAAPTSTYNVVNFGAKADGKTDCTKPFIKAWQSACTSLSPATIYVPKGRYLLGNTNFRGPCKRKVTFLIAGTLVAPEDYKALGNSGFWILFNHVENVVISGGKLDAKGAAFWNCRRSGKNCPVGARLCSMTFNWVNNLVVSGITSVNSQLSHLVINPCNNVLVKNVKLIAPDQSPNTDGIHVERSTGVTINGCTMQTGDDCISIGDATYNLFMSNIKCGPGHGVSIGSLGKEMEEKGVENVTLTNAIFSGSDNGVRIKTWARPSNGFVRNVRFQNIIMDKVENPIIIDQNYCPNNQGCPGQISGIKISQITYSNIKGSSATSEAVTFDCSPSNPCQGIKLQDINLNYNNRAATPSFGAGAPDAISSDPRFLSFEFSWVFPPYLDLYLPSQASKAQLSERVLKEIPEELKKNLDHVCSSIQGVWRSAPGGAPSTRTPTSMAVFLYYVEDEAGPRVERSALALQRFWRLAPELSAWRQIPCSGRKTWELTEALSPWALRRW